MADILKNSYNIRQGIGTHSFNYTTVEGLKTPPVVPANTVPARKPAFILCEDTGRCDGYKLGQSIMSVVGKTNVKCVQVVKNLWRIYCLTEAAKTALVSKGITFEGKTISVYPSNPLATGSMQAILNGASKNIEMVRLNIKDLCNSVSNDSVKHLLCDILKLKLATEVKESYYRDPDSKLTSHLMSGDRYVYVHPAELEKPLPRYAQCGIFSCRLIYRGQFGEDIQECYNCFSRDHKGFECKNPKACKVCKMPGHKPGSPDCLHYNPVNDYCIYGGSQDPLSNHYEHPFEHNHVMGKTVDHHWYYKKAMIHGQEELATLCITAPTAAQAKAFGKGIRCVRDWDNSPLARSIMRDIQLSKFKHVEPFADRMADAHLAGQYFVEAVPKGRYSIWSTGLTKEATMNTDPEHWTGMNQMGQILSGIAIDKFGQFMAKTLLPSNTLIMDMYLPETPMDKTADESETEDNPELTADNKEEVSDEVELSDPSQPK